MLQRLQSGSKPSMPISSEKAIPRPLIEREITQEFLTESKDEFSRFGVIIGPSGCGKTYAIRHLCNKQAKGVLYYEIDVFSKGLGQEIGMKLSATKTFDLLLGYVSQAYCHYHVLPEDKFAAFQRVIEVLEEAAIKYKKKYSRIPVIFIDGVDILAKYNE